MRRAWALTVLLATLPVAGAALPAACDDLRDPSLLPAPAEVVPIAALAGFELELVEAEGADGAPTLPEDPFHNCGSKIRPGARLHITWPNGTVLCSANWVFQDETGALYVGTAGHCIPNTGINRIEVPGLGDIGDTAFTTGNGGVGNDFALIRISPSKYGSVEPTMCRWGGPVKVAARTDPETVAGNTPLVHYGFGTIYNTSPLSRGRVGFLPTNAWGQNSVVFEGFVSGGDSGSAVQTSYGGALGIITHVTLSPPAITIGVGQGIATRVDRALDLARWGTGHTYEVVLSDVPVDVTGLTVP